MPHRIRKTEFTWDPETESRTTAWHRIKHHVQQELDRIHAAAALERQLARLIRAIRLVLNQSLARQGTTLSSFETPYGGAGENANFLRAYGQAKGGGRCGR